MRTIAWSVMSAKAGMTQRARIVRGLTWLMRVGPFSRIATAACSRPRTTDQNLRSHIVITSPGCTEVCRSARPLSLAVDAAGVRHAALDRAVHEASSDCHGGHYGPGRK
jgi:hypothetical protein